MPSDRGTGPLCSAVAAVAAGARASGHPDVQTTAERILRRIEAPPRVAIAGRVSAGKSTLLNALLGSPIAATSAGETTKVVAWYRIGSHTTAQVVPRGAGRAVPIGLVDGMLPSNLPVPTTEVERVEVTLSVPRLRDVTLIDTPGMASINTELSQKTTDLLSGQSEQTVRAGEAADAVVFVVNGELHDDEFEAVRAFRAGAGRASLTAGTAIAVLSKADQLDPDPDTSWKAAQDVAASISSAHRSLFAAVVPVVGLLAETAETGALREPDVRALAELARTWTADERHLATLAPALFLSMESSVPAASRQRLVDLLGMFGIAHAWQVLDSGAPATATALRTRASERSGIGQLSAALEIGLVRHTDALKAASALTALAAVAQRSGDSDLARRCEQLTDSETMFPLRLIDLGGDVASGAVRLPADLADQAHLACGAGLPRVGLAEAVQQIGRWRSWSLVTDGIGQRAARTMERAWQLAAQEGP